MSADADADAAPTTRYGVFLRPDPLTCWVQAQVNTALVQQFGVVSAAAFPPHATLVGNLRTDVGPDALAGLLEPVLDATAAFTVSNAGIVRLGGALVYDVHGDATGRPNRPLVALAEAVRDAVLAVSLPIDDHLVTPVEDAVFHGHLSLGLPRPRRSGGPRRRDRGLPARTAADSSSDLHRGGGHAARLRGGLDLGVVARDDLAAPAVLAPARRAGVCRPLREHQRTVGAARPGGAPLPGPAGCQDAGTVTTTDGSRR